MFGFGKKKTKPKITAVQESQVGLVRDNNEDHLLVGDEWLTYCVADGMGGGADGETASQIVCAEISMLMRIQPEDFASRMESVCNAITYSSNAISDYAQAMGFDQMGTTASVLLFDPEDATHAVICHIGDSRIYRFRKGKAELLTRDHSVAAEIAERYGTGDGNIDRDNPLSHVLTKAIGTGEDVKPDWRKLTVEIGDRYLLCTDGVHDVVSIQRLDEIVGTGTLEEAKQALTKEVLDRGAPDNFSFIILEVEAR